MYVVVMPHLLLAAMALAVGGDLFLHAARGPRLIGVHLRAPVGDGLWVHVGHGSYPPVAPEPQSRRRGQGVALRKPNEASGLTEQRRDTHCRVDAPSVVPGPEASAGVVTAHRAPPGSPVGFCDTGSLVRR